MPKRVLTGTVVSAKMNKTVVVSVEMPKRHPVYQKLMKNTRKFKARDDIGVQVGAQVQIEECPPFSKTVVWKVVQETGSEEKK